MSIKFVWILHHKLDCSSFMTNLQVKEIVLLCHFLSIFFLHDKVVPFRQFLQKYVKIIGVVESFSDISSVPRQLKMGD